MLDRNLTAIERRGLRRSVNLADGHARQRLSALASKSLRQVCDELLAAGTMDVLEAEYRFLDALGARLMTKYHDAQSFVLYSASISIDLAAKLLRHRNLSVHLMTPTFDNLAALVAMNGVEIKAVAESRICPAVDFDYLDQEQVQSLFVVLPNNPTGARVPISELDGLFDWAARKKVLLILDMTFRYLIPEYVTDLVAAAASHGASALVVDDTGKVLSLLDTKMSVLTCTADLAKDVERIYEEILLNTSAFDMELLTAILDPEGICASELTGVRQLVKANRVVLQDTLRTYGVRPTMAADSEISVEWVRFGSDAERILGDCEGRGLQLLPGRLFFWNASSADCGRDYVRIALMRDTDQVEEGCKILAEVLADREPADLSS